MKGNKYLQASSPVKIDSLSFDLYCHISKRSLRIFCPSLDFARVSSLEQSRAVCAVTSRQSCSNCNKKAQCGPWNSLQNCKTLRILQTVLLRAQATAFHFPTVPFQTRKPPALPPAGAYMTLPTSRPPFAVGDLWIAFYHKNYIVM